MARYRRRRPNPLTISNYRPPEPPKREISHLEFWAAYHYITEGIVASTELAPYYADWEIERNCELQRRLRVLMEKGIVHVSNAERSDNERVEEVNYYSEVRAIRSGGGSKGVLAFRLPDPNKGGAG